MGPVDEKSFVNITCISSYEDRQAVPTFVFYFSGSFLCRPKSLWRGHGPRLLFHPSRPSAERKRDAGDQPGTCRIQPPFLGILKRSILLFLLEMMLEGCRGYFGLDASRLPSISIPSGFLKTLATGSS